MKMYFPRCWISLFPLYQFHGLTFLCHLMVDLGSFVISRVDLRSFVISGVDLRLSSQGWIYVKWHHSIFQLLIGYFKEGRSGSVKNKTTRREGERGHSAASPRLPSRRVVLFFTLPFSPSLKYPIKIEEFRKLEVVRNKKYSKCPTHLKNRPSLCRLISDVVHSEYFFCPHFNLVCYRVLL